MYVHSPNTRESGASRYKSERRTETEMMKHKKDLHKQQKKHKMRKKTSESTQQHRQERIVLTADDAMGINYVNGMLFTIELMKKNYG